MSTEDNQRYYFTRSRAAVQATASQTTTTGQVAERDFDTKYEDVETVHLSPSEAYSIEAYSLDREEFPERSVSSKSESCVAREFQNNALSPDLRTVPGVGAVTEKLLNRGGITHTDELIAHFFMQRRDEANFVQFLEDLGIKNQHARETARQLVRKVGYM
jgi:predicted flap endonuclease-1-like 5' DNA nuclease